jgi:FlaA1/EpsC-like NDP-sugar epimerase
VASPFITYRRPLVVLTHIGLWTAALLLAFLLRFDFQIPVPYWHLMPAWLGILLTLRIIIHSALGLFRGLWRYSGTRDLLALFMGATASTFCFALVVYVLGPHGFPRSILAIDWLTSIMAVGGLRFGIRAIREIVPRATTDDARRRVLVVGAGDTGETLVRELVRLHARKYQVIGFLDDNLAKVGQRIHDIPVIGAVELVQEIVEREKIDEVVIAIPSATSKDMRRIVDLCATSGAEVRRLPGLDSLIDGRTTVSQLQNVNIEDLLGRDPVKIDDAAISEFLRGRVVVVTGAGGSIGSELCRQICRFGPAKLLLVERAENNLFHIHRGLLPEFPAVKIVPYVADICNAQRMGAIFALEKPAVVFHAAAYKHVPMMEWNPTEALNNNVLGTRTIADVADAYGVEKFVMVSTDKAVNPTSIMGVTKRAAEIYVQALSQRSKTHYITVRFGNVLGSEGSVIPIFKEMIAKGGPVMVTHPEMTRYFMTIPEACQLVMQAGVIGNGGDIMFLDMGAPVKIVDLARDLIRLSGLLPGEDIEIKFSGLRPGEKLFEELFTEGENVARTAHPKIFLGRFRPYSWDEVEKAFVGFNLLSTADNPLQVRAQLGALVPEFAPPAPVPEPSDGKRRSESRISEVSVRVRALETS